jgi:hypothetical protein
MRRLDGRIDGQQVGLLRDLGHRLGHVLEFGDEASSPCTRLSVRWLAVCEPCRACSTSFRRASLRARTVWASVPSPPPWASVLSSALAMAPKRSLRLAMACSICWRELSIWPDQTGLICSQKRCSLAR